MRSFRTRWAYGLGLFLGLWGCDDAISSRFSRALSVKDDQTAVDRPQGSFKQRIGTIAQRAEIHAEASPDSAIIGTLAAGNLIPRSAQPVGREGCRDGWYAVEPRGYLCLDKRVTLDEQHPTLKARSMAANRADALPYPYAVTRHEASLYEADPKRDGVREQRRIAKGSVFAVVGSWDTLDEFDQRQRLAMLTTGEFVSVRDIEPAKFPKARAVSLGATALRLPLAFVTAKNGTSFRISAGHAEPLHDLESTKALQLGGNSRLVDSERYWALPSEGYVRDSDVVVLRKRQEFPSAIGKNTHFADLDLTQGALVLYEGREPFYATLALRLPRSKPATTIAYVKSKQVTLLGPPSPAESTVARLDVAWVIELTCGLRLQAANSPLELAKPAPEGVIELHPEDAHRLFQWLEPAVPDTWHGVTVREPEREGSPILLR